MAAYDSRTEEERMAAESAQMNTPGTTPAQQAANAALLARLDPASPTYVGPGYVAGPVKNGQQTLKLADPTANAQWKETQRVNASVGPAPALPTDPVVRPAAPAAPVSLTQRLQTASQAGVGSATQAGYSTALTSRAPAPVTSNRTGLPANIAAGFDLPELSGKDNTAVGGAVNTNQTPTEAGPAEFDRTRVDSTLDNLDRATSGLFSIGESAANLDAVYAKSAIDVENARRAALGQARSGSRRDRAMNERAAIAAGQTIESDAQRANALAGAQAEVENQRVRTEALKAAGDLGLNQSALEIDVGKMNLDAVTNYWNQRFETDRLGMQLTQQEAERLTNFTRDMALIARDYRQMDLAEQDAIRSDLTARYGFDKNLEGIVKQLDAEPGFWEKAGLGLVSAAGAVGAGFATKSDVTVKQDVADTTDAELGEFLGSLKSQTWKYIDPGDGAGKFLGVMAQDLQKTELGRSMVAPDESGTLTVDARRQAAAAMGGLVNVHERLKKLEEMVN